MLLDFSAGFFPYNKNNSPKKDNDTLQSENKKSENSTPSNKPTSTPLENRHDNCSHKGL